METNFIYFLGVTNYYNVDLLNYCMSNAKSLGSDIDFIKEFEELKIKQKLLVETLNKKHGALRDEHLININSKLDFLVTLFKDANNTTDVDPHKELVDLLNSLAEKIDLVEKNFETKVKDLEEKISKTIEENKTYSTNVQNVDSKVKEIPKEPELDYSDIKKSLSHHQTEKIKREVLANVDSNSSLPKPNFKVSENLDIEKKVSEINNPTEPKKEKKFKWF